MQGLIGKKIGMTRLFDAESGQVVPVTVIQAGRNIVCQVKTQDKDGYQALQLGFEECSKKNASKPRAGHFQKNGLPVFRVVQEFKTEETTYSVGTKVGVEIFDDSYTVDIVGTSKGRGFTGTVKRHNFSRGRETHGNTNHREPGSIGACSYPARVFPGKRMAGQYGGVRTTLKGLRIVGTNREDGLLFVRGSIPGKNKGIVLIYKNRSKAVVND